MRNFVGLGVAMVALSTGPGLRAAAPRSARPPCRDVVERARSIVAEAHWRVDVRERAAARVDLPGSLCVREGGVEGAMNALLREFGDPAIRLLPQSYFETTLVEWDGAPRVGVGLAAVLSIDIDETTRKLTVISPVPESPAALAGLRAGDVIEAIDDTPTDSLGLTGSVNGLRVAAGDTVRLTVRRDDEAREVVLRVDSLPSLSALDVERREIRGGTVLVIRLERFSAGVGEELREALTAQSNVDAIVLDLQRNPGGRLDELADVAGAFLGEGRPLARLRGPAPATIETSGAAVVPAAPIAVLQSYGTASAAEVLAAALRTHVGARLYGERTFGKGLVHRAVALVEGEWVLMLPVGELDTLEGVPILRRGVDPDVRTTNPATEALKDLAGPDAGA